MAGSPPAGARNTLVTKRATAKPGHSGTIAAGAYLSLDMWYELYTVTRLMLAPRVAHQSCAACHALEPPTQLYLPPCSAVVDRVVPPPAAAQWIDGSIVLSERTPDAGLLL